MEALYSIMAFIGILSVIVFVHEFGHYAVAKFFGVITGLVGVGIVHLVVEVGLIVGVYVLIKKHVHALLSKLS